MTADDTSAVPDTDAEREALAWFREVSDVRAEMRFYEAWDHAATIVRAALARDVPAESRERGDISRELRGIVESAPHLPLARNVDKIPVPMLKRAADEIDRLRAELATAREVPAPSDEPMDETTVAAIDQALANAWLDVDVRMCGARMGSGNAEIRALGEALRDAGLLAVSDRAGTAPTDGGGTAEQVTPHDNPPDRRDDGSARPGTNREQRATPAQHGQGVDTHASVRVGNTTTGPRLASPPTSDRAGTADEPISGSDCHRLPVGSVVRWHRDRTDQGLRLRTPTEGWVPAISGGNMPQYVVVFDPSAAGQDEPRTPRTSAPRVFEVSDEDGNVVVSADMPDEDDDHVEYARALLDAGGHQPGWYGLSTAHGPANPDRIDYRHDPDGQDKPTCPEHGPGDHITGQAFGMANEFYCARCDDTFLWRRPAVDTAAPDPLRAPVEALLAAWDKWWDRHRDLPPTVDVHRAVEQVRRHLDGPARDGGA